MKFNVTDVEFDYCNELVTHDDEIAANDVALGIWTCLLYTSPSPRDGLLSRMPSSA